MVLGPRISKRGTRQVRGGWSAQPNRDLAFVKDLIETGKVRPVIDRVFPLEETRQAFRHFAGGHSRGKVIVGIVQAQRSSST